LHAFSGRSRKGLIELARRLRITRIPSPSTGCALTEPALAAKVHDLIQLQPDNHRWDFELLRIGRHVRYSSLTKVVLGRREEENRQLLRMFQRDDAPAATLLEPDNFVGPLCLVIGPCDDEAAQFAAGLVLRFARTGDLADPCLRVIGDGQTRTMQACLNAAADLAVPM
jgi:tRNA-specific 2-thiouridylase